MAPSLRDDALRLRAHVMGHGHHHGWADQDHSPGSGGQSLPPAKDIDRVCGMEIMVAANLETVRRTGALPPARTIPMLALGMALSLFFVISFVICVIGYLLLPGLPFNHAALAIFLPGFELLSRQSFLLGPIESFIWGWFVALIFGPLYNFFVARIR